MEERSQAKPSYDSVDRLFNLKPYRDYINTLNNKDSIKLSNKQHLPIGDVLTKKEMEEYKQYVDLDYT